KRGEESVAEESRLASRLQWQVVDPVAAAELRLHGFAPVVLDRHRQAHRALLASRRTVAVKTAFLSLASDLAFVAAQIGAVVFVAHRAIAGAATAGDVALIVTVAFRFRYQVYWVVGGLEWTLKALRTISRLTWLVDEVGRAGRR